MRPLSELPNTEGFRFVGIRHDGSRVACVLHYQDPDGNMSLRLRACNDRVDCEDKLAGWESTCACTGVVHRGDCPEAR